MRLGAVEAALLALLRDSEISGTALRALADLPAETRRATAEMISGGFPWLVRRHRCTGTLSRRDHAHRQHWPQWRRRRPYRASQGRRHWNACADATP